MAASQGPLHRGLVITLHNFLLASYPPKSFSIADHSTIWALPDSLPEPDIAVVRGPAQAYFTRLPTPSDTVMVLEVAVTTVADAREKAALYAEAGFAYYFLVDGNQRTIDVYSEPSAAGYRHVQRFAAGEPVPLPEVDGTFDLARAFEG